MGVCQELPDIRTVPADLTVPPLEDVQPAAGKRVRGQLRQWQDSDVYHTLYLPRDWQAGGPRLPVIVEWAGNGGYESPVGDICTGRPEGCKLGYGLSGGVGYVWLCLPYLNTAGDQLALKWWGDPPTYDPRPTLDYCRAAVAAVCAEVHGDPQRVILCGFSRGAIACNFLGLHDEQVAQLWCGFMPYSHYDGVRSWPYPGADRDSAKARLQRLGGRPQFIVGEGDNAQATAAYLANDELTEVVGGSGLTFMSTGFRNHNDEWILRPSAARQAAREWLQQLTQTPPAAERRPGQSRDVAE